MNPESDLYVPLISSSLSLINIDLVISGSIAATESPKFIRCLRRLGASVYPYLTDGGKQFTTETAVGWASDNQVITSFDQSANHIALNDCVVVAPASANFISSLANGITDTPALALVSSYLGQGKKVLLLPAMHGSLFNSPIFQKNLETLKPYVTVLQSRLEEGKKKFPNPETLADIVSHEILKNGRTAHVSMGSTKGFIDDVRYISNYSSGSLGTQISHELFRNGISVNVSCGACEVKPNVYSKITHCQTNEELLESNLKFSQESDASIFVASVLDFVPESKTSGKISSKNESLELTLKPTEKIISQICADDHIKIGFKLETNLTIDRAESIAFDYIEKYSLKAIIINDLSKVSKKEHHAWIFKKTSSGLDCKTLNSKKEIAHSITDLIIGNKT